MARKSYSMTQEQYDTLISAMQSGPLIMLQCGSGMSQQERANLAWAKLGEELGFKYMTVLPGAGKLDFTAEPDESFAPPAVKTYEERLLDGFRAAQAFGTKPTAPAPTTQHDNKIFGSEATLGEFYKAVEPAIEFLATHFNPHARIIIDCASAEILSGLATHRTERFVQD